MKVILKEEYTEKERLTAIRDGYHGLGNELFILCQNHAKLSGELKEKLTEEVCIEYARQSIYDMLQDFWGGEFDFKSNDSNVKELAVAIGSMNDQEYEKLLQDIEAIETKMQNRIDDLEDEMSAR